MYHYNPSGPRHVYRKSPRYTLNEAQRVALSLAADELGLKGLVQRTHLKAKTIQRALNGEALPLPIAGWLVVAGCELPVPEFEKSFD